MAVDVDHPSARCGKPLEECSNCRWRGGNRPEHPCVKCGGDVIVRPCQLWRVPGTTACVKHGSGHPAAKKAGRQRIARGQAAKTLRDVEVVPLGDPLEELANMAARIVALEQHAADQAAEAAADGKTEQAAAMADVHRGLVRDAGKLLERCARLNVEGRRTEALVAQAQTLARIVEQSIALAFAMAIERAEDGRISVQTILDVQHREVTGIVRRQMTEAEGEIGAG